MKVAEYFQSGMVLQQGAENRIFGEGKDGETVFVTLQKEQETIQSKKCSVQNGKWTLSLDPVEAGTGYTLQISNDEQEMIVLDSIAFGDVYLLAGQSNIEFRLQQEKHFTGKESLNNIRLFAVPQIHYYQNGIGYPSCKVPVWQPASGQSLPEFSAIGYYIGTILDDLHMPIGLVSCSKGGTSASCWLPEEILKEDPEIRERYLDSYWRDIADQSDEEEDRKIREYEDVVACYQKACEQFQREHPKASRQEMKQALGHTPWPGPKGKKDAGRPCGLYQTMFKEIEQVRFKAVIWYQGEEDAKDGELYERLLKLLINGWHKLLPGNPPFYIVQLPNYAEDQHDKWPLVREAQKKMTETLPDCELVVSLDCGESYNIHPEDKSVLGKRIGQAILDTLYLGKSRKWPALQEVIEEADHTILVFDQPVRVLPNSRGWKQLDAASVQIPADETAYAYENDPEVLLFTEGDELEPLAPFRIKKEKACH